MVDIPDHVPHFAKGMIHPLKVTAATGPAAAEPTADATVSLADYSFTTQGSLTAGKHTIKVVNKGPQPHEVELVRLAPGKTMKDANEFMDKAYAGKADGPPPFDALGGIASEVPGMSEYFTADLTPGKLRLPLLRSRRQGRQAAPRARHDQGIQGELTASHAMLETQSPWSSTGGFV